jgi:sugar lactone lactonase YvrE
MYGCALFLVLLAAVIGYVGNDIYETLGYRKEVSFSDDGCVLLETPTTVEDLTAVGDGHCVIGGGGDVWHGLGHGAKGAKDGAFWLVNVTAGTLRELPVTNLPKGMKLVPHGIHFSQTTRRLYVVNHDEAYGESVQVFAVAEAPSFALAHVASVQSPLFNNFALNDVVEGVDGEFYVTEWLVVGRPHGGSKRPNLTMEEKLQQGVGKLAGFLKVPTTRIFRCKLSASPQCEVASPDRFVVANGITVSSDGQSYFVADTVLGKIFVLGRESDGTLKTLSEFKTKHAVDNIEMSEEGELQAGSLPLLFAFEELCEDGLGANKVVGGRNVGCGSTPGGLLSISLLGTGGKSFVDGVQTDVSMHDGSKLSQVSAALKVGSKVAMGSPTSPGVLVCPV